MEKLRALIIEDSEDDAELLLRELKRGGYDVEYERVYTADGTAAALRKPWDVIISDHNMQDFDAQKAMAIVHRLGVEAPFIIVSGSISEETAVAAMRAGAHDFVTKGRLARLIPAIRRELKESESRRRRRQAEDALRHREELYSLVIGATQDTIYDADLVKGSVWFSENFEKSFGYQPREGGWTRAWWEEQIHPEDRLRVVDEIEGVLRRGADTWSGEYRFRRADQSYVTVYNRGNIIYDGNKRPVRWIGSLMDISDKRGLEDQLRHSQKMEAIGQLAGGIAHDFNNLLSVILGYADFVSSSLKSGSTETVNSDVDEIRAAAARAASLTRQLLTFSRRQVLQPTVMDLNYSVSAMENMLRRLIGENISLETSLAPDIGPIRADPGQIEQIILNLAVNARDAMPNGGTLRIATRLISAEQAMEGQKLFSVPPGRYVALTAIDTGIGMDENVRSHIFEPFFTTKEKGKGTGLGLSTVYGAVKQAGGYIRVDSEPGKGSTFTIILPQVSDGVAEGDDEAPPAAAGGGPVTVFVVEDEATIRAMIRRFLDPEKNTIIEAASGEDALVLAREHAGPIHLVITDVIMPGMTGIAMMSELCKIHPESKVLFMSGYTENASFREEIEALRSNFLEKPFSAETLRRKVGEILSHRPDEMVSGK